MAKKVRILLVEDDVFDQYLFKAYLEEITYNFDLLICNRLSTALEMLDKEQVNLIFTDLSLPDSRGVDHYHLIKDVAEKIPVIAVTGSELNSPHVLEIKQETSWVLSKETLNDKVLKRFIVDELGIPFC